MARMRRLGRPTPIPAAAMCRIKPSSRSKSRSQNRPTSTIQLKQDHGGWNSDDNQNHNLGRMRFSFTTTEGAEADPVPAAVREILAIPREKRPRSKSERSSAIGEPQCPNGPTRMKRSTTLWNQHPEGATQLVLRPRAEPRETHVLARGSFLKPGERVEPGVPSFLNPLPARAAVQSADARPLAGRSQRADDGPRGGQSHLAGLFRHRAWSIRRRISAARAMLLRIRICSIGWRSSSWTAAGA